MSSSGPLPANHDYYHESFNKQDNKLNTQITVASLGGLQCLQAAVRGRERYDFNYN